MQARINGTRGHPDGWSYGAAIEASVRHHLAVLFASPHFDASSRSRVFLRYVVDEALAGRGPALNQAAIAISVFGRDGRFDPLQDPIVRVQAGRLRRSLERYYLLSGESPPLRIELQKGSYSPVFVMAEATRPDWQALPANPFEISRTLDEQLAALLCEELMKSPELRELIAASLRKADVQQS